MQMFSGQIRAFEGVETRDGMPKHKHEITDLDTLGSIMCAEYEVKQLTEFRISMDRVWR